MPIKIDSLTNRRILSISCGDSHTIAVVAGLGSNSAAIIDDDTGMPLTDVVGWGENSLCQVSGNSKVERYTEPVVISELTGKRIINVGCHRAKTSAVELGGNVYEWGGVDANPIRVVYKIEEAQEIIHGNNFTIVRSIDKVYFWGEIRNKARNIISERDPTLVSGNIKIDRVSVGYDHVLATDKEGLVYFVYFSSTVLARMNLANSESIIKSIARED